MRIQTKVFLAVLAISVVLVAAVMQAMQWSLDAGLIDYVDQREREGMRALTEALAARYADDGSWDAFRDNQRLLNRYFRQYREGRSGSGPGFRDGPPRRGDGPGPRGGPRDGPRDGKPGRRGPGGAPSGAPPGTGEAMLLDAEGKPVTRPHKVPDAWRQMPIMLEGAAVGFVALPPLNRLANDFELDFIAGQRDAITVIAIAALVLAGLFALGLAPAIVSPVRRVAVAASELIQGNYEPNLPRERKDEIGDLYRDINELAMTLDQNRTLRQRWIADISHELRTPVAIVRGEVEAMMDGVRPLNQAGLESLLGEIHRLQKLVEDLGDLGNADIGSLRYRKERMDMGELVRNRLDAHESLFAEAGLDVAVSVPVIPVWVRGDDARLGQMLDNCLVNSTKYTDSPGNVDIDIRVDASDCVLTVSDSGPGVPDDALPQLFDYLYRVETSRSRETGGSGLGLSIVARIVAAHEGTVTAAHSKDGGITIEVRIPLDQT